MLSLPKGVDVAKLGTGRIEANKWNGFPFDWLKGTGTNEQKI